jgi:hypothetical protein
MTFAMFSDAGNKSVQEMLDSIVARYQDGTASTEAIEWDIEDQMEKISKTHPEITDTDVRDEIAAYISYKLGRVIWNG